MKAPPVALPIIRNVAGAMGVRLVSMLLALLSVPLLLRVLGAEDYGIWATLTSLLATIALLDLGVGNSLRNSVAAAVTEADRHQLQSEFLGLFRLLSRVCLVALLLLLVMLPWVDLLRRHLLASLLLYPPYLLMLPFLLGTSVLQGAGRVALQSFLQASAGWAFFLFVGACYLAGVRVGLAALAVMYSLAFVASVLAMFRVAQGLQGWQLSTRTLLRGASVPVERVRVGISFLVLQASSLILYGMGNAIIYSHLGPAEVARYDVVNKIFQVGLGFYNIMISVMWSEISRQRSLGNSAVLRLLYRRMLALSLLFSALACLLATFMPVIVGFWTGGVVAVTRHEALIMAALVSLQAVAYVGAVFLNAFERITIQVVLSVVSIALMVPLSLFLLGRGQGIAAVPLAAALLTLGPLLACHAYAGRLLRGGHDASSPA